MSITVKTSALAGLLSLALLGGCVATVGPRGRVFVAPAPVVFVARVPPAERVEVAPVAPGPAYVWVGGHWAWRADDYVWVPGHYAERPYARAAWVPGRWRHDRQGWYWVDGHWR